MSVNTHLPCCTSYCQCQLSYAATRARRIGALCFTPFRCPFLKTCGTVNGAVPDRPDPGPGLEPSQPHARLRLRHVLCIPSQEHHVMLLSALESFMVSKSRLRPMTLRTQVREKSCEANQPMKYRTYSTVILPRLGEIPACAIGAGTASPPDEPVHTSLSKPSHVDPLHIEWSPPASAGENLRQQTVVQ